MSTCSDHDTLLHISITLNTLQNYDSLKKLDYNSQDAYGGKYVTQCSVENLHTSIEWNQRRVNRWRIENNGKQGVLFCGVSH